MSYQTLLFILWAASMLAGAGAVLCILAALERRREAREARELAHAWAGDYADLIEADDRWTL